MKQVSALHISNYACSDVHFVRIFWRELDPVFAGVESNRLRGTTWIAHQSRRGATECVRGDEDFQVYRPRNHENMK